MSALQPQIMTVPLYVGQNSSTDPRILNVQNSYVTSGDNKVFDPGANAVVENARLNVRGQVQKRYGFTSLTPQRSDGTQLTAGAQVFSTGQALFQFDGDVISSYSPSAPSWGKLNSICGAALNAQGIVQTVADVTDVSCATLNGFTVTAWAEGGAVYVTCIDNVTQTTTLPRTLISANAQSPNVICVPQAGSIQPTAHIFYAESAPALAFKTVSISLESPYALGPTFVLPILPTPALAYDVAYDLQSDIVAHWVGTDVNGLTVLELEFSDLFLPVGISTTVLWTSVRQPTHISICHVPNQYFLVQADSYIILGHGGQNWSTIIHVYNSAVERLVACGTNTVFMSCNSSPASSPVTPSYNEALTFQFQLLSPHVGQLTNQSTADWEPLGNMYLLSRPFQAGGQTYCWYSGDNGFQSKAYLLNSRAEIVGIGQANGIAAPNESVTRASLCVPVEQGSATQTSFPIALRYRTTLEFNAQNQAFTSAGVRLGALDFAFPHIYSAAADHLAYMSGVAPQIYDGVNMTEWGFYSYPTCTVTAGGGGVLTGGTYFVATCFAWYDATGKLWRSAPSLTQTVVVPANGQISVTTNALTNTRKQNVFIEVYCSANVGGQTGSASLMFKVTQINSVPSLPGPITDALVVGALAPAQPIWTLGAVINVADATLQSGEPLYTSGGFPDFLTTPALNYLSNSGFRLYGVSGEDSSVYVTVPAAPGAPLEMLDTQTVTVPMGATPLAVAEVMDGRLYLATERNWFETNADVSDLSQTVVTFAPPRRLAFDAGVLHSSSVLNTGDGLYHQSVRGIMLLSRQEQLNFIGEPVKNYTDAIVDTYIVPKQQQIRFVSVARTLSYDYQWGVWTQNVLKTLPTQSSGCRWQDVGVLLGPNGHVHLEQVGVFFDDTQPIVLRIETPWVKMNTLAGWGRTWRFMILGELRSAHTLQVRVAYQYDPTWIDTFQIASSKVYGTPAFGQGLGTFGRLRFNSPSGFGANPAGNAYQFLGIMRRQKAGTFKFEITDVNSTGEDVAFNVLALLYGTLPNISQVPTWKKMG